MKNAKTMMLNVQIDQDSDDDYGNNKNKINTNYQNSAYAPDKYQSTTLTPGLFSHQDQDINYNVSPKKQQIKQNYVPTQDITISHRSSHLLQQQDNQNSQDDVEKIQRPNNIQYNQESKGFIIPPLGSKQLLNICFDESDEEQLPTTKHNRKYEGKKIENLMYSDIQIYPDQNTNIRQFVRSQIPQGKKAEFTISRDKSGINYLWPEFSLIFDENGKKLAYAKKMIGNSTANYYITIERGLQNVDSDNFLGKIRSNFAGSVINIFSQGLSPLKVVHGKLPRYIQATIKYNGQLLPKKPRQFQVFIIKDQYKYSDLQGVMEDQQIGLDILYNKESNQNKIWLFRNRKPIYSEQAKAFILNFGGRVQKPSIKNFILEDPKELREVMMLGKTYQDIFKMEVCYPIKPYIALGISLAHCDSKYTGE